MHKHTAPKPSIGTIIWDGMASISASATVTHAKIKVSCWMNGDWRRVEDTSQTSATGETRIKLYGMLNYTDFANNTICGNMSF